VFLPADSTRKLSDVLRELTTGDGALSSFGPDGVSERKKKAVNINTSDTISRPFFPP